MNNEKIIALFFFSLIGLGLSLLIPIFSRRALFTDEVYKSVIPSREPLWIGASIGIIAILLFSKLYNVLPWAYLSFGALISVVIGYISDNYRWRIAFAIYLGILVATVLPWWMRQSNWSLSIDGAQTAQVLIVMACVYWVLIKCNTRNVSNSITQKRLCILIYILFGLVVACLVLSVGLTMSTGDLSTWHHWGAYIGPAQLLSAGVHPFNDIPLQYGLGSALILALGCKVDCWASMYWLSSFTTIMLTFIIAWIALQFIRSRHPLLVLVTLSIVLVSCLFWTAFPPSVISPLATPSTSGMRFLPGVLMLAWALNQSKRNDPLEGTAKWGHLLWLGCIAWSPEAGIHATAIWVPYFVWTRTFKKDSTQNIKNFLKSVGTLILVFTAGLIVFGFLYRLILGEWPMLAEYLTYMLLPPGAMPINLNGTIWFAIACLVSWFLCFLFTRGELTTHLDRRASWLVALLSLATFTYYLGRSHDNNILNLMPYLSLLLLATCSIAPSGSVKAITTTLLSAVIGFTMVFGWTFWDQLRANELLISFSTKGLVESYNRETEDNFSYRYPSGLEKKLKPTDAAPILKYIHKNYEESAVVLDPFLLLNSGEKYAFWSALQVPTNFILLPTELRRKYMNRVAERLKMSGWVVYKQGYEEILLDFDSVYNRIEEIEIGSYKAIRYSPR